MNKAKNIHFLTVMDTERRQKQKKRLTALSGNCVSCQLTSRTGSMMRIVGKTTRTQSQLPVYENGNGSRRLEIATALLPMALPAAAYLFRAGSGAATEQWRQKSHSSPKFRTRSWRRPPDTPERLAADSTQALPVH